MDVFESIAKALAVGSEAKAVEFRGRWHSWKEMAGFGTAVATVLPARSDASIRVAVVARNRPGHVAALLALLAGRHQVAMVYAFQSASQLADEIRSMDVAAVVVDADDVSPALADAVAAIGATGIAIDGVMACKPAVFVASGATRHAAAQGLDVAIEILSSGTTGRPKRIPIRADTINRATADMINPQPVSGATPDILAFPIGNIGGLYYLIPSCANSTPLVLLEKFDLAEWLSAVTCYRPAYCVLPPAAIRTILDKDIPRSSFAGVASIGVGAAPLAPDDQEEFERRYGIPILVGYGATEFCGVVAAWTMDDHKLFAKVKRGSVGRARPGVRLRVAHPETGATLSEGEQGVLEAQVERIGPEWMRTTDLASIDTDGFLFLHGRLDDIINRGGFKIQPGKIEDMLRHHAAVAEVAVVGAKDARLGEVPVAVVELRPGAAQPSGAELDAFLRAHLRPQEVPARYRFVAQLPRTPSTKVKRGEVRALVND